MGTLLVILQEEENLLCTYIIACVVLPEISELKLLTDFPRRSEYEHFLD